VENAVITHAHSDHARRGSGRYWSTETSVGLLRARLGRKIQIQGIPYEEAIRFGEVRVSFHGAGHILGSAQVRVEHEGQVWVASGDYKREPDPSCEPFEVVSCDVFVTEATFGTPRFVWPQGVDQGAAMEAWWNQNRADGMNSLIYGYSLGKTQRILAELARFSVPVIWIHESMSELTECYREAGRYLAATRVLPREGVPGEFQKGGELVLAPPSAGRQDWLRGSPKFRTAFASGWMQGQRPGNPYRGGDGFDHGFVLSDHADWNDLNRTIRETGASRVFVMHRENGALVRHLRSRGVDAHPVTALEAQAYSRLVPRNLELFTWAKEDR
jgi:putative mRNA 3-end processing factor